MHQQNVQARRNGKILRNIQLTKTESRRNRNMNRLIVSKDIESVIKNLPKQKNPEQNGFTGEF